MEELKSLVAREDVGEAIQPVASVALGRLVESEQMQAPSREG